MQHPSAPGPTCPSGPTRSRVLTLGLTLGLGLALGWATAPTGLPRLGAVGPDRIQDRAVLAGPIGLQINKDKITVAQDAIYYLNYSQGLLLATIPAQKLDGQGLKVVSDFAERDLLKDFAIAPGDRPHFLMTTASLGLSGDGWAPLFVFETQTGQVATYQVQAITSGGSNRPVFKLLEVRRDPRLAHAAAAAARN